MSNFLKRGKRETKKQIARNTKHAISNFQKTLFIMNEVYHKIMNDADVTVENFDEKLSTAIGKYKLTDKQLDMIVKDLMINKGLINEQQQPEEEAVAYAE